MFAYMTTERRLFGFDAADWSIIVLSLALVASLTLLLKSPSRTFLIEPAASSAGANHDNRPTTLPGSTKPRQATTSSKIRDVTFIALAG
jgi:hypothetical protein